MWCANIMMLGLLDTYIWWNKMLAKLLALKKSTSYCWCRPIVVANIYERQVSAIARMTNTTSHNAHLRKVFSSHMLRSAGISPHEGISVRAAEYHPRSHRRRVATHFIVSFRKYCYHLQVRYFALRWYLSFDVFILPGHFVMSFLFCAIYWAVSYRLNISLFIPRAIEIYIGMLAENEMMIFTITAEAMPHWMHLKYHSWCCAKSSFSFRYAFLKMRNIENNACPRLDGRL